MGALKHTIHCGWVLVLSLLLLLLPPSFATQQVSTVLPTAGRGGAPADPSLLNVQGRVAQFCRPLPFVTILFLCCRPPWV